MDVDKKIRVNKGIVVVLLLSVIPMYAWKIGYNFNETETWRTIAFSFAKVGAFGGMAMFALSLILSGRYSWLDRLFGGLDKVYIAHRFLGTFSLVLLFLHPISLSVLRFQSGASESLLLWFKVSDFGIWLGSLAFYSLLVLVLWSIFAKSKYETFLKVHKLLGVVFIIGALHAFISGSILASNSFMFWYMLLLTVAGSTTFVMYSLLEDIVHRPLKYTLSKVKNYPNEIVELQLVPSTRIINFAPGQFVYVEFEGLEDQGYHPFSISSSKSSSILNLAIRKTGDLTESIENIRIGSTAHIKGPYGGFVLELRSKKKQLWIAGGIGVTPFLSGAESLRQSTRFTGGDIEMVYATDDKSPYGFDKLLAVEERNKIFNVTLFDKKTFGYVSLDALSKQITDLAERDIFVCGPPPMLAALRAEAEDMGFDRQLKYEEFGY